jgi:hypothetical protein
MEMKMGVRGSFAKQTKQNQSHFRTPVGVGEKVFSEEANFRLGVTARTGDWVASSRPRTPFDWLSRDGAVADAFMSDSLCLAQLQPAARWSQTWLGG